MNEVWTSSMSEGGEVEGSQARGGVGEGWEGGQSGMEREGG